MQKVVTTGKAAMDKILEGVNLVADPVKSTIGPKGRLAIISESYVMDYGIRHAGVVFTKDGYNVSKQISSPDNQVQVGVLAIQAAIEKQMNDAGDATSTCGLFTQEILTEGIKLIQSGQSHVEVTKGINAAVEYVVSELKKMATPIDGSVEKIRQVATVCSNNDPIIGGLIADAFSKIGVDGVINIEEAKGRETTIKISDGIKFHRGWASQYFVTNKAKAECVLDNPYILIYDRPITQLQDKQTGGGLMPLLEKILQHQSVTGKKKPLMIFCDAADGEALATLTFNNQTFFSSLGNQGLQSCVVEMAFLGQYKKDFMEDIAAATGGVFVNELKGTKLENVSLQQLGECQKVVVGKDDTVIIGGAKDEKVFNSLAQNIKVLEQAEEDPTLKELFKKRLARLTGSVAILSVGATTEVEMKEKKDRVDDAVRATRSAIEEGYVIGGGTMFLRMHKIKDAGTTSYGYGWNLIMDSLYKPVTQICINAGVEFSEVEKEIFKMDECFGYNAKTGSVEDLVKSGIIEPAKSNRCAIQNAASVACQILSSQYTITDTL